MDEWGTGEECIVNDREPEANGTVAGESEAVMRERFLRQVFGGDEGRYQEFCRVLTEALPENAAAVLRGSAVTGTRWEDGAPFDADGPGTSDLDLTIVGGDFLANYTIDGFYLPGIHSKPLSEEHPDVAPDIVPLRERLSRMVGRPVNIQGTRDWVMFVREYLMGQPYLTIVGKAGDGE
jgi:hypothetical protein